MILVKMVINAAPIKIRVIYDFRYDDILSIWNNNNMSMYIKGSLGITAEKKTMFREAPSLKLVTQRLNGYIPILNRNITSKSTNTVYK